MPPAYQFFFALICAAVLFIDKSGLSTAILVAAALHETGHILACLLCGCKISFIGLTAFGIAMEKEERGSIREFIIIAAGPIFNLICWLILVSQQQNPVRETFAMANLILTIFNILPVCPLDGWRIIHTFLLSILPFNLAEKISFCISVITISITATIGFYLLLRYHNLSLVVLSGYYLFNLIRENK